MVSKKMKGSDLDYYSADRAEMLQYIAGDNLKVLDVGCGTGNFGRLIAREKNAEVWGIEIEPEIAGILDKNHFRFFTITSIENMFQHCGYSITFF